MPSTTGRRRPGRLPSRPAARRSGWKRVGRGIGTGAFLLAQSAAVLVWVAANIALAVSF